MDIQQVRLAYALHKDRLNKISAHYKKKLVSDGKALPNTLKSDSPSLPQPAQTEVARRTKVTPLQWSQVHAMARKPTVSAEVTTTKRTIHKPMPAKDTFTAMQQLLQKLSSEGPRFQDRPPNAPFDVVGGHLPGKDEASDIMTVGSFNVAKLTDYKLNAITILMLQAKIDVMVLTDTQHTKSSAQFFRKSLQENLGGGNQSILHQVRKRQTATDYSDNQRGTSRTP